MNSTEDETQLSDDLRTCMEECLAVFSVNLEGEEEVFETGERDVGATSPDHDMEQRPQEPEHHPSCHQTPPHHLLL